MNKLAEQLRNNEEFQLNLAFLFMSMGTLFVKYLVIFIIMGLIGRLYLIASKEKIKQESKGMDAYLAYNNNGNKNIKKLIYADTRGEAKRKAADLLECSFVDVRVNRDPENDKE